MGKTSIMTLRLPIAVRRGVERLAAQQGHKPAQIGARLVEEGLRRREFPQIDLRDTTSGRVAYLKGTRFAVYWVVQQVRGGMSADRAARVFDVSAEDIDAALAYAHAFPDEIEMDMEMAESNRRWIEAQDAAWREGRQNRRMDKAAPKSRK